MNEITRVSTPEHSKQNAFNPKTWESIKEKILSLDPSQQQKEEQLIQDCQKLFELISELNSCSDYNSYFSELSIKNRFFKDTLIPITKKLLNHHFSQNNNIFVILDSCFEQLILFWLKTLYDRDSRLEKIAKTVLDPLKKFYTLSRPVENVSVLALEHLNWVKSLKEGDIIDCLKVESRYGKMNWGHALVEGIDEAKVKVSFLSDCSGVTQELNKKDNPHEIAPYKSKCVDFEWRMNLKKGDELDVYKKKNMWCHATILETKEEALVDGRIPKKVKIGYRIYSTKGNAVDHEGRKYSGWSSKSDEWLCSIDPRLRRKNSVIEDLSENYFNFLEDDKLIDDDSNDLVYNFEEKILFAVTRPNYSRSTSFAKLVNILGEKGIFHKIYERIADKINWAPIETVSSLCYIIGKLSPIFHREFAIEYIPKFQRAVINNLLDSPEWNIKNFTGFHLSKVLNSLEKLLKRVHSFAETRNMITDLRLKLSTLCLKSQYLKGQLYGISIISEFIKYAEIRYITTSKTLSKYRLTSFLHDNNILMKIINSQHNFKCIQNSKRLLLFSLQKSLIDLELFQALFMTALIDKEVKAVFIQVLSLKFPYMNKRQQEFLMSNIDKMNPQQVTIEDIDLVFRVYQSSKKSQFFAKTACDFYWKIISSSHDFSNQELSRHAASMFCDTFRNADLNLEDIASSCVENIKHEVSVSCSIEIIKSIILNIGVPKLFRGVEKKTNYVKYLFNEIDLENIMFENIKNFKEKIQKKLKDTGLTSIEALDLIKGNKASFCKEIIERVAFLYFFICHANFPRKRLNYKLFCNVWEIIIKGGIIPKESQIGFSCLDFILECGLQDDVEKSLHEFLIQIMDPKVLLDKKNIIIEGFEVFRKIFVKVNPVFQFDHIAKDNLYYDPRTLQGIEILWEYIWVSKAKEVIKNAINFLDTIYSHPNIENQHISEIRKDYIRTCNKFLKVSLKDKANLSGEIFTAQCSKYWDLLSKIIDHTEKKGIGDLQKHCLSKIQDQLISLSIENHVNLAPGILKGEVIMVFRNSTIFELRIEIGKRFKVPWDQFILNICTSDGETMHIDESKNGKTLKEMDINPNQILFASPKPKLEITQGLLLDDGTLEPTVRNIFSECFDLFSDDGKMDPEQCANLIHACSGDNCQVSDRRVNDIFLNYDDDRDGYLTKENFLDFYLSACKQRPLIVCRNINSLQYLCNQERIKEEKIDKPEISSLLRYTISTTDEYFQPIFDLLDLEDQIAKSALKFLNRLPTSPKIVKEAILFGVPDKNIQKDWNTILNLNSKYKLHYLLNVIDLLNTNDPLDEKRIVQMDLMLCSLDPRILEQKKLWKDNFNQSGGLAHLFKILQKYGEKLLDEIVKVDIEIILIALKILKTFLVHPNIINSCKDMHLIELLRGALNFIEQLAVGCLQNRSGKVVEATVIESEKFRKLSEELTSKMRPQVSSVTNFEGLFEAITILGNSILNINVII